MYLNWLVKICNQNISNNTYSSRLCLYWVAWFKYSIELLYLTVNTSTDVDIRSCLLAEYVDLKLCIFNKTQ